MSVHLFFEFLTAFVGTDCLRPALPGAKGILCKLWSGRRLWLDLLQVTAGWLRALQFHLFCHGSCRFSLQAQCGPAPLSGDDLSRCRHLPAGSGSRDLLDCLLCRDGSAGQSFRPWIPDFEDRGGQSCLASCLSLNFHKSGFAGRSAVRLPATDPHPGLFQLQSPTTNTESRYIQQCSTHLM